MTTTPSTCPYTAGTALDPADPGFALDPADPAFAADPYPFYAALRGSGPAAEVPLVNGSSAWLVTGYDQVRAVLADPRFSNVPPQGAGRPKADSPAQRARALLARHMLNTDAPDHTRLRRLVTATFTPRRVDALRPRIEELTAGLLRRIPRRAEVDLVDAFAFPLPVLVIGEVLGVPTRDRAALREWTYRVGSPADALEPGALDDAWSSLHGYFSSLIEDKRRAPGEDLFSSLVGSGLSGEELLAMAFLLLFAGYETTMNLLASAVLLVLGHAEEPTGRHWPHVVEETLRHASPLEGTTWRRAVEDVEVEGVRIPAGASVLGVLAAASRDPGRYPDPDAFRPERWEQEDVPPSLAFGHGPHYCVGARLARLEAQIALPALFEALPGLRLAEDPALLPYRPGLLVRGPRRLPVRTPG
ncbi:cytochrome P450 family protein [Wenjunlia tyrosinilytica]|uniref:Cytochrome P450 hydroxylase n=1 Tax=Wenjunlia tyrosinilytica TaxID=1544741 RepID=A0A918DSG9_9ACTN|nr:cytochrome P450 [Wenjunlia tyrosinilytica]GGO81043.1 cytochrome P450 hydroxylase [Wenjunlia tyrosinilytica]